MKSKPVYAALEPDESARRHLVLALGPEGLKAAQRFRAAYPGADAAVLALGDQADWENTFSQASEDAGMDTAFYLAGPEVFLWQAANMLRAAGAENSRIRQHLAGSVARRVYCVHCRTVSEQVTTALHCCAGCGLTLTVRDHFSRPLAAYMGVIADPEALHLEAVCK
jgi:hypothetical protein